MKLIIAVLPVLIFTISDTIGCYLDKPGNITDNKDNGTVLSNDNKGNGTVLSNVVNNQDISHNHNMTINKTEKEREGSRLPCSMSNNSTHNGTVYAITPNTPDIPDTPVIPDTPDTPDTPDPPENNRFNPRSRRPSFSNNFPYLGLLDDPDENYINRKPKTSSSQYGASPVSRAVTVSKKIEDEFNRIKPLPLYPKRFKPYYSSPQRHVDDMTSLIPVPRKPENDGNRAKPKRLLPPYLKRRKPNYSSPQRPDDDSTPVTSAVTVPGKTKNEDENDMEKPKERLPLYHKPNDSLDNITPATPTVTVPEKTKIEDNEAEHPPPSHPKLNNRSIQHRVTGATLTSTRLRKLPPKYERENQDGKHNATEA